MTTFSIDELSEQSLEDALDDLSQLQRRDEVVTLELKDGKVLLTGLKQPNRPDRRQ